MNFFEYQDKARLNTKLLIFLFLIAVLLTVLAIDLVVAIYFYSSSEEFNPEALPQILAQVSLGVIVFIVLFSLFKKYQLSKGGAYVAESLGAKQVDYMTSNFKEKVLINVVEEMSIASGTPVPKIYILEEENINAFAAGYDIDDAAIAVTRGALNKFSRDELQAVIAHEFSHIFNGDMRININLMAILFGILVIGLTGRMIIRSHYYSSRNNNKDGRIVIFGLALLIIGYIGFFFGNIIKAMVSRQREYLADASSAQFTRNPKGIANALKKIGSDVKNNKIKCARAEEYSHAFFSQISPTGFFTSIFATHPPLIKRIKRVEPNFNGEFDPEILNIQEPQQSQSPENNNNQNRSLASMTSTIMAAEMVNKIENIGNISQSSINNAHDILQNIPSDIMNLIHNPKTVALVIYASLLDKKDPQLFEKQLRYIQENTTQQDIKTLEVIEKTYEFFYANPRKLRLSIIEISFPALRNISQEQYQEFNKICQWIIKSDGKISLSQWCIKKIIFKTLDKNFLKNNPIPKAKYNLKNISHEVSIILSLLSHIGSKDQQASQSAFTSALSHFKLSKKIHLLPLKQANFSAVSKSLQKLVELKAQDKEIFLKLCVYCASHDEVITSSEAEILQAIAAILDCPLSLV